MLFKVFLLAEKEKEKQNSIKINFLVWKVLLPVVETPFPNSIRQDKLYGGARVIIYLDEVIE